MRMGLIRVAGVFREVVLACLPPERTVAAVREREQNDVDFLTLPWQNQKLPCNLKLLPHQGLSAKPLESHNASSILPR